MTLEEAREHISDLNPEALLADGFETALIGYATIFNRVIAAYDRQKCIDILMQRDGMTEEEAEEFFEFNVTGAYMGEHTPCFITRLEIDHGRDADGVAGADNSNPNEEESDEGA